MVNTHLPPPTAEQIMDMMARWVARIYGVKVTVRIEGSTGESTTIIDGRN